MWSVFHTVRFVLAVPAMMALFPAVAQLTAPHRHLLLNNSGSGYFPSHEREDPHIHVPTSWEPGSDGHRLAMDQRAFGLHRLRGGTSVERSILVGDPASYPPADAAWQRSPKPIKWHQVGVSMIFYGLATQVVVGALVALDKPGNRTSFEDGTMRNVAISGFALAGAGLCLYLAIPTDR